MSRPFIESVASRVRAYHEIKEAEECDTFSAHRIRRSEVLVRAAQEAATFDELRQVVLEHLDPQVLRVPRG